MVLSRKRWCLAAFGVVRELSLLLFLLPHHSVAEASARGTGDRPAGRTRRRGAGLETKNETSVSPKSRLF